MTVSVIIPTKYRHEPLLNTVESVILQTSLPSEIIIVDQNESSDIKEAVLSLFNGLDDLKKNSIDLLYIHDPEITGLTQARNRAVEKSSSDIILFLDDDVILENDFVLHILEIYRKHPDVYGAGGIITNIHEGLIGTVLYNFFLVGHFRDQRVLIYSNPDKYKDAELIEVTKLPGGLTSYRREIFQEFAFDENLVAYGLMEDYEFSFRVSRKYRIVITPKARLEHLVDGSGRAGSKKQSENIILTMHYFYRKNLNKNIYNCLCYIWMNIGYIINGILFAVFKKEAGMLKGYIEGLKKIIMGDKSEFILVHRETDK